MYAFAVVALALLVIGCGAGNGDEPVIGEIPEITDPSDVVLPLDVFSYSPEQYRDVQLAAWQLIRDCVTRFGGEYTVPKELVVEMPALLFSHERRYGIADENLAATNGYHVAPELLGARGKGGWNPSPEELVLVRGTTAATIRIDRIGNPLPEGGCGAEADAVLSGSSSPTDGTAGFSVPDVLASEAHGLAEGDSRVREAMAGWSACMARQGYRYRDVWEANDQGWPTPAGDDQIATAVSDVRCKHEVNLVGIWSTVEAAYQERLIEQHRADLDDLRARLEAETANAAQVLGAS